MIKPEDQMAVDSAHAKANHQQKAMPAHKKESTKMKKTTYQLETLACPSCSAKIGAMLKKTPGIEESQVLFNSSRVKVSFDETIISSDDIKSKLDKFGYPVISEK